MHGELTQITDYRISILYLYIYIYIYIYIERERERERERVCVWKIDINGEVVFKK